LQPHRLQVEVTLDLPKDVVVDTPLVAEAQDCPALYVEQLARPRGVTVVVQRARVLALTAAAGDVEHVAIMLDEIVMGCGPSSAHSSPTSRDAGRPEVSNGTSVVDSAPSMPHDVRPGSERAQTDESLRAEREKADHALEEQLAAIDETADAVIARARTRADDLLAAARAKTDQQASAQRPSLQSREIVASERVVADQALRDERADADEAVRQERADQIGLLSTERRETDRDLLIERVRSDHVLATRDEFLGIVSHDLRNLLNAIVGFATLIAQGVLTEDHVETVLLHAQRIQRSGGRMNRLIGDLVDVASIEAGSLAVTREVVDPGPIVTEAVDTFQAQATAQGVTLLAELVPPLSVVALDPARILQVVTNLLSNALKFTPRGGTVVVRVERIGEDIRFSVIDTGVGIPRDKLEAVFVRFLQVQPNDRRGVGLGLYISKCIVQGHGGRIWAESNDGGGSALHFTLPVDIVPC
jgi:signal transduction histidine kinase